MNIGEFYDQISQWYYKHSGFEAKAIQELEDTLSKNIEMLSEKDAKAMLYHHLRFNALEKYISPKFNPIDSEKNG